jgi:hypothetical protein
MAQPTRWSFVCAVCVAAWLAFAFSCATGGQSGGNQDANVDTPQDAAINVKQDSSTSMLGDAPHADASLPTQDAFVPMQDAGSSGPFCMSNSQCTNAGECCLSINGVGFCAPGTVIAGVCFPIQ